MYILLFELEHTRSIQRKFVIHTVHFLTLN